MWRFVSGTQRGASFNWHTNCCNTRTHTDTQCFQTADTENVQLRIFTQSHGNIEKVHSHMRTDIFWSDRHRKASSLTHTQYIDVCRCGKTCDTHTQTRACKHIQIFTLADASPRSLHNRRLYPKCHPALVAWTHNYFWFKWICCSFNLSISNKKSENTSSVQLTSSQRARSHL